MFTGIIQETGRVVSFQPEAGAWKLVIAAGQVRREAELGDSIAVNGCCLTAARLTEGQIQFDVLEETRRRTNFNALAAGSLVNLEGSLRFGGKVGGHFVTGHIDTTGEITAFRPEGKDHYLRVRVAGEFMRQVVMKGSIAIDGVSLTVAEVAPDGFAVWLIPHTLDVTNLRTRRAGDAVNLEFDLLGKHVDRLLAARGS
ncbi:MAG TPA: riboflavin synthase [Opitutaceae bacterium]|nr:riboflavin synthase [Opitutaceae bacterium]